MAINNNPMLTAGQTIPADLLQLILSGQIESNRYSPSVVTDNTYGMQGVGQGGDMVPVSSRQLIAQPRNISTWGGNDSSDVWDAQGNYLGTNSGGTALRGLANLIAQAVGGYYGTQALNGATSATGAAAAGGGSAIDASVAQMAAQPMSTSVSSLGTIPGSTSALDAAIAQMAATPLSASVSSLGTIPPTSQAAAAAGGAAGSAAGGSLAQLAGAAIGAAQGRNSSQTTSRDPWAPAQPWMTANLQQGQQLQNQYSQQPFSQAQQTAYGNFSGLLNAINSGASGLMGGFQAAASGANNYDRSNLRRPLQGSSFNFGGFQPGLLNFFPQTGGR